MNNSIFEKTMQACISNKTKLTEKTNPAKKTAKTEAVKKLKKEADVVAAEIVDDEEDIETIFPEDIEDGIVVVVDPELTDADYNSEIANMARDIIDNTDEDQVPTYDEYIDDFTYICPVCGVTFFTDEEMHDGDKRLLTSGNEVMELKKWADDNHLDTVPSVKIKDIEF
jgi:rubrerythrin